MSFGTFITIRAMEESLIYKTNYELTPESCKDLLDYMYELKGDNARLTERVEELRTIVINCRRELISKDKVENNLRRELQELHRKAEADKDYLNAAIGETKAAQETSEFLESIIARLKERDKKIVKVLNDLKSKISSSGDYSIHRDDDSYMTMSEILHFQMIFDAIDTLLGGE